MVRELPTSKSSESSEQAETSTKNEDSTVAGSVKTNKLDPDDVLPEVVTTKSTNEDNNLPPVRSGSQPGPDEFESYDFDEHRDLMLPNNVRTYAGGQFYRETELPSLGPMSLPNRQRYRPEYDSVLGATSPRSPSSAYQFAPRSHFYVHTLDEVVLLILCCLNFESKSSVKSRILRYSINTSLKSRRFFDSHYEKSV